MDKTRTLLPVIAISMLVSHDVALAQFSPGFGPPGGMRGGGGGGADGSFDRLVNSYGGRGDVLEFSRISPEQRARVDGFSRMMGLDPLPTSGSITREQYRDQYNARMAKRFSGGGPGGGPPGMTTTPIAPGSTPPSSTTVIDLSAQSSVGPPGGGPPGGFGGGRGFGGPEDVDGFFAKLDQNKDGKLTRDEASAAKRGLGSGFEQYDTNRDGFMDINEFRAAIAIVGTGDKRGGGPFGGPYGGGPYGGSGGDGSSGGSKDEPKIEPEDERPVVYRFGKLPKDFEKEYGSLDSDKDGQIGLYEWRTAGKDLETFLKLDLNGDGFLTAEEHIRYTRGGSSSDGKSSSTSSGSSSGSKWNLGSNNSGSKDSNRDRPKR